MKRMMRRLALPAAALALATVTACGNDSDSPTVSDSESHNTADLTFATDMIPHHAQAIEMADMALAQAGSEPVVDLAQQIKAAQDPEIEQMTAWLETWGEPTPDNAMPGTDPGEMPGMMSAQDMEQMSALHGAAFDRMWLQTMTEHHEGAITMAESEVETGENADAQALAQNIIDAQTAEIETMTGLLENLNN